MAVLEDIARECPGKHLCDYVAEIHHAADRIAEDGRRWKMLAEAAEARLRRIGHLVRIAEHEDRDHIGVAAVRRYLTGQLETHDG